MVARIRASALVMKLAKEVRAGGDENILDETIHHIFSESATSINNEGIESQIETIINADGDDEGSKIIRALIEGSK